MITRRDALKLGAAGFAGSIASVTASSGLPRPVQAGPADTERLPNRIGDSAQSTAPASVGPTLDRPIIVKWKFETGVNDVPAPAIANGITYIEGGSGRFYALNSNTGIPVWTFETNGRIDSSPVVAGNAVYFGSHDGVLYAFEASSGSELWRLQTGGPINAAPVVHEGSVYVGSHDSSLWAMDAETGIEQWRFSTAGIIETSPVINAGFVFLKSGDKTLYAIDGKSGEERWRFQLPREWSSDLAIGEGTLIIGNWDSDVVDGSYGEYVAIDVDSGLERWRVEAWDLTGATIGEGMVFFGDRDYITAKSLDTGSDVWWEDMRGWLSTPIIDGDILITGHRSNIFALEISTGEIRWRSGELNTLTGTPTVVEGVVYAKGTEIVACDLEDGAIHWTYPVEFDMRFNTKTPTVAEGNVYAGQTGLLYVIGNMANPALVQDVELRASPSPSGAGRGLLHAGDEIMITGSREERNGEIWIEVTVDGVTGWIPMSAIDPATLPPEGEIEYVFVP